MKDYLEVHRRIIADGRYDGDALWVSARSQPQSAITIRHQLCKWTEEAFGLPITPHLFRDCAATSLAVHSPEEVQIAHLILGNTYAVMQKHYNLARVVEAACTYHDALERLRMSLAAK
jgi:integrase/recombinase XerD